MLLTPPDVELCFKLHRALMFFVNQRLKVLADEVASPDEFSSLRLTKFKPGDWNEIEITVKGTEAICKCNGEQIGKSMKIPATDTIGLQSEYGRFEFRHIRIKEMP